MADAGLTTLAAVMLRQLNAHGLAAEANQQTISTARQLFEHSIRAGGWVLMRASDVAKGVGAPDLQNVAPADYGSLADLAAGTQLRLTALLTRIEKAETIDMATREEVLSALRGAVGDQANLRVSIENMIHTFADQVHAAADGGDMADVKELVDNLRSGSAEISAMVIQGTPAATLPGTQTGIQQPAPGTAATGPGAPAPAATRTLTTDLPAAPAEGDTFTATWSDGSSTPLQFRGGQWVAQDGSGTVDASGAWVPASPGGATGGGAGGGNTGPTSTNLDTAGTGPAAGAAGNRTGAGPA